MDHVVESKDRAHQQVFDLCIWTTGGTLQYHECMGSGLCAGIDADTDDVFFISGSGAIDGSGVGGGGADQWGDDVEDDDAGELAGAFAGHFGGMHLHADDRHINL